MRIALKSIITITVIVLTACGQYGAKQPITYQPPETGGTSAPKGTVAVTLNQYWVETISREEALKRLATRHLAPELLETISRQIPDVTEHYLIFTDRTFREFAAPSHDSARLLLLLPVKREEPAYDVVVPLYDSEHTANGHVRHVRGVEVHQFENRNGVLFENGVARQTFRLSQAPTTINVDISFLATHPGGSWCCNACEWVHSALDIHCADWLCCLGCCDSALASSASMEGGASQRGSSSYAPGGPRHSNLM